MSWGQGSRPPSSAMRTGQAERQRPSGEGGAAGWQVRLSLGDGEGEEERDTAWTEAGQAAHRGCCRDAGRGRQEGWGEAGKQLLTPGPFQGLGRAAGGGADTDPLEQ